MIICKKHIITKRKGKCLTRGFAALSASPYFMLNRDIKPIYIPPKHYYNAAFILFCLAPSRYCICMRK